MAMVWTTLRFLALILSALGYVAFARAALKIPARASYLFALSSIACAVYLAGLAGVLVYAAWTIFALGLVLLLVLALTRKLALAFNRSSLGAMNLAFLIGFAAVFLALIDARLVHYDNFSHWALAVKHMLITDRFPDASSAIIDFTSYPLGAASYLCYVCRVAGNGEGVMLAGQGALLVACFYAIFGVIRDTKRFLLVGLLALGCASMAFFNGSICINTLLVDFLLPALALACAAFVSSEQRFPAACLTCVPPLALLVIVKNTGVFFAALCWFYLFYRAVKAKRADETRRPYGLLALGCALLSLTTLALWYWHTAVTFGGDGSKFSIDLQNLGAISIDKSPDEIRAITALFLSTIGSLRTLSTLGILLFNTLALIAWLVARFGFCKRWKLLWALVTLDCAAALYYAGILGMYILSMPLDEALRLAGFERYASSIVIFLIGGLSMCLTRDVENSFYRQQGAQRDNRAFRSLVTKSVYQAAAVGISLLAGALLLSELNGMNSAKADYPASLPARVEKLVGDNWAEQDDGRYLFYASDTDRQVSDYYLQYVARYLLFAPQVDAVSAVDEAAFAERLKTYDTLVIVESDAAIRGWMRERAGLPGDAGVYRVADILAETAP